MAKAEQKYKGERDIKKLEEYHNYLMELKQQIETLEKNGTPDAEAKIKALSDEVARLTAILNNDGTNSGTSTSKTPIGKEKHIPNSRNYTKVRITSLIRTLCLYELFRRATAFLQYSSLKKFV